MAFKKEASTATDLGDLFTKLKTFINTTVGWTQKKVGTGTNGQEYVIYYSTGESAQEEIYLGITKYLTGNTDICGIQVNGYTGYLAGNGFEDQPGAISFIPSVVNGAYVNVPYAGLHDSNMKYWFFGDKDVIIAVIRVVSSYPAFYAGLIRRFALRTQDPYPMLVDGSGKRDQPASYAFSSEQIAFGSNTSVGGPQCLYDGTAWKFGRRYYVNEDEPSSGRGSVWFMPYCNYFERNVNDKYTLFPLMLGEEKPHGMRGAYKWIWKTQGKGLSAEDIVTIDTKAYIAFPDALTDEYSRWYIIRNYE